MPRYKLTIEYDGTGISGWQRQKEHLSVQQIVEEAIFKLSQEDVTIQCSGRTDAGVHARGQVAHFDLNKEFPLHKLRRGLNSYLPEQISIIEAEEVSPEFNARFDATERHYRYHIINRDSLLALDRKRAWQVSEKLDINAMREGAKFLIGEHDFSSFRASACQAKSPMKAINKIEITQDGENIFIDVSAQSFLHHMIRNITGNLVMVGKGRWQPEKIKEVLELKDRKIAAATAPAYGLYFIKVDY